MLERADMIVVDQREAALEEAGEIAQAIDAGVLTADSLLEIGTLLKSGEHLNPRGVTVFKSVGVGIQDWAIARLAVERVQQGAFALTGLNDGLTIPYSFA
jgi:ornithine cyclodeaminase